jgi:hypothetical protein
MALQERSAADDVGWTHYCDACSGPMKIVSVTPNERLNGGRFYACEYVCCDCGHRNVFDEVL